MAKRSIEEKKRRRIAKALRRGTLPAYFDLVELLVSRGLAPSRREARLLILAKRVKVDSHPVGVKQVPVASAHGVELVDEVDPYVPVAYRDQIVVF